MFQPFYSICCESDRDLIRIVMSGFFTVADVERFAADRAQHHARLRCERGQHRTLCDVTGMKIQTRDVVAAFAATVNHSPYRPGRMAVVVGSSLARLQTLRVMERTDATLFHDTAAAEAWLFAE